ncbi:alpha/beta fold hydrolase [Caenimonas aquaedulcis]|uniref:Alpha/beta hydrolase n=1 Tax=Caenimonas aquaedulcis TaxID=2793270 RepID=A0A931H8V9_9BURK|nr:alpha/beta hydrolase [Caenimonas aquaedulcis]MBG9390488.1 alpha/beta hydrolase [Caenimonas aquaedulcis]
MSNSVVSVGSGPRKVLALHGWFGSAEGWGPMVESLDTAGFTYVFMDCRGYGGARHMKGEYTMQEVARDAVTTADFLGWDRFSLVGHSMGGAAIQHVLASAPERVQALVGITPVPASGVPFDEQAWALFSSAAQSEASRRAIIDFSTGSRLSATWVDRLVAKSMARSQADAFGAYLHSWARTDISSRIQGAKVPVKVIVGEHDPGLNAAVMQATWLAWYPNATLDFMANAGHYPMDETPVALATTIEKFLKGAVQ